MILMLEHHGWQITKEKKEMYQKNLFEIQNTLLN